MLRTSSSIRNFLWAWELKALKSYHYQTYGTTYPLKSLGVGFKECVNFDSPEVSLSPTLTLHLVNSKSEDIIFKECSESLRDAEMPGVSKLSERYSDDDLIELKAA